MLSFLPGSSLDLLKKELKMRIVKFNLIGGRSYECDSLEDESGEYVKAGEIKIYREDAEYIRTVLHMWDEVSNNSGAYGSRTDHCRMEYQFALILADKLDRMVTELEGA